MSYYALSPLYDLILPNCEANLPDDAKQKHVMRESPLEMCQNYAAYNLIFFVLCEINFDSRHIERVYLLFCVCVKNSAVE